MNTDLMNSFLSNPWIGLIGILIGALGIAATFWVFYKERNYPCRISYYPAKTINLFRNLSSPFSNLKITYNNKDIGKNLFYLSGYLVCDGYRDITKNEEPITLKLPDGYNWVDLNVSSSIDELNIDLDNLNKNNKPVENKFKIHFTKFKKNESIYIQSIIEGADSRMINPRMISFEHRINDTESRIKIKGIVRESDSIIPIKSPFLLYFCAFIFFVSGFSVLLDSCGLMQSAFGSLPEPMNATLMVTFLFLSLIFVALANQNRTRQKIEKTIKQENNN